MSEPTLHDAKDYVSNQAGRMSPADRMVAALDGRFYTIRRASEIIGVNRETMRRALKTDALDAPSKVLTHGKMEVWLLTDEDLLEVAEHFNRVTVAQEYLANN